MTAARRRGRIETNLLRSAVWDAAGMKQPDPAPFSARTLLGMEPMRASRRLSVTDMAVLAAACARLPEEGVPECPTSLYELSMAVFGHAGGENLRLLEQSLTRCAEVTLVLPGFDFVRGKTVGNLAGKSVANLIEGFYLEHDQLRLVKPAEFGGLKGKHNLTVVLTGWFARQVRAGFTTWLDLELLRALGPGLAGRLWAFLEGEDLTKRDLLGHFVGYKGLGQPALETFGVAGYARHVDARRALKKAGERIVATDPKWVSVTVEKRAGWQLHYSRLPSDTQIAELRTEAAAERRERQAVRQHIKRSLHAG